MSTQNLKSDYQIGLDFFHKNFHLKAFDHFSKYVSSESKNWEYIEDAYEKMIFLCEMLSKEEKLHHIVFDYIEELISRKLWSKVLVFVDLTNKYSFGQKLELKIECLLNLGKMNYVRILSVELLDYYKKFKNFTRGLEFCEKIKKYTIDQGIIKYYQFWFYVFQNNQDQMTKLDILNDKFKDMLVPSGGNSFFVNLRNKECLLFESRIFKLLSLYELIKESEVPFRVYDKTFLNLWLESIYIYPHSEELRKLILNYYMCKLQLSVLGGTEKYKRLFRYLESIISDHEEKKIITALKSFTDKQTLNKNFTKQSEKDFDYGIGKTEFQKIEKDFNNENALKRQQAIINAFEKAKKTKQEKEGSVGIDDPIEIYKKILNEIKKYSNIDLTLPDAFEDKTLVFISKQVLHLNQEFLREYWKDFFVMFFQLNDYKTCHVILDNFTKEKNKDYLKEYFRIELLIQEKRYHESLTILETILQVNVLSPAEEKCFLYLLAECHYRNKNFETARDIYKYILVQFSDYRLTKERLNEIG